MKAPFLDGNLMHHPSHYPGSGYRYIEWREVEPFIAIMIYDGFSRGRSAAYFTWHDTDGHSWPMFMKDMDAVLNSLTLTRGITSLEMWTVAKRGMNYGIALTPTGPLARRPSPPKVRYEGAAA